MMRSLHGLAAALLGLALAACSPPSQPAPGGDGKLRVFTSVAPEAWIVSRVAGERAEVEVLVPPGQSPHNFEPSLRQVDRLAGSRVYFRGGLGFERGLLPLLADLDGLEVVDLTGGLGERGDPHTWLVPALIEEQAEVAARVLSEQDPEGAADYQRHLAETRELLEALDRELHQRLDPYRGRAFLVYHPAWTRFAEAYGLVQLAVEVEGKEPVAQQLDELVERARSLGIRVLFVQPGALRGSSRALAEALGARVELLDPLARELPENLRHAAELLLASWEEPGSGQGAGEEPAGEAP